MKFLLKYRYVLIFVIGAALFAGGFALERGRRAAARRDSARTVIRGSLGPTPGPDAEGYIASKRRVLDDLAQSKPDVRASALVSLSRFVAAADVPTEALVIFVRFPGSEPEVLPVSDSVSAALQARAEAVATKLRAEADALDDLARRQPDEAAEHTRAASEKRSTANSATVDCSCVYAYLSVPSSLDDLQALSRDPRVRFVDVSEPPRPDLRGWELRPVLPKGA